MQQDWENRLIILQIHCDMTIFVNKNAVALSHVQYDQGIIWVQKISLAETGVNKKNVTFTYLSINVNVQHST